MEESRYSWKQMPDDYNASYYNEKDYQDGKIFTIIDNITKKEYQYPLIEPIRDQDGKIYGETTIDPDLWNEEFIGWAISTSKDFVNYVKEEWLTPRVLNYVVTHYEFPEIFGMKWNSKLRDLMTKELWNKAFQRNKEVTRYVPKEYVTSEMINSLGEIKNPSINNINCEDLTPELFEKMYFNSDTENKLYLIPPAPDYRDDPLYSPNGHVEDLITQKIADDILSLNIRTIWHIPKKFISKEIAIKAMETDFLLMPYVPVEYQTPEYQKRAIDKKTEYLSLIDPSVMTDEMIYYALSKKGSALGCVPKDKRTLEVCEYAIENYGKALRNVPENIKNSDLCFKAVVKDPSAIKYVPVEFLNQEFVDALNDVGIVIPYRNRGYVDECLITHKKLDSQQINLEENLKTPELEIDAEYSNIELKSMPGLLTEASLNLLLEYNITTVGDLLKFSDNSTLYSMILNTPKTAYREISGAIRLLKCKFMDIDPLIDIPDTGNIKDDMRDFSIEIGFSTRTLNLLCRNRISPKRLIEIVRNPAEIETLYRMRHVGEVAVYEIIHKITILIDFYDKKKKATSTEDETIETLNEELTQIRDEIERLNNRTDEVITKIQEKMQEKNKGGVLK